MDTNQVFSHTHLIRNETASVCFDANYHCLFTVEPVYDEAALIGYEAQVYDVKVSAAFEGLPGLHDVAPRPVTLSPRNPSEIKFRNMLAAHCLTAWANGEAAEHVPGPAQGKSTIYNITNEAAPALAVAA